MGTTTLFSLDEGIAARRRRTEEDAGTCAGASPCKIPKGLMGPEPSGPSHQGRGAQWTGTPTAWAHFFAGELELIAHLEPSPRGEMALPDSMWPRPSLPC